MTVTRTHWTAVCYGLALLIFAAYQMFKLPPVLPVLLQAYDYDRTLAGGFMSIYALVGLLVSVGIGKIMAKRGPAGLIVLGLRPHGGGQSPGPDLARDRDWLCWAPARSRVSPSLCWPSPGPVLANTQASAQHLPLVAGLVATWIPWGQIIASLAAPLALSVTGWRGLWYLALLFSGGFLALTLTLMRRGQPLAARPGLC